MALTILSVAFFGLLVIGVPVAFAIGLSSVATIVAAGLPVAVVFQKMVGGMQVFSFLAIPFFVFAGELMLYGGIADRIVRFAEEEVDVALRVGEVIDESLVAHALASPRWATVASPTYLARRGRPQTVEDLASHACLRFAPPRGKPRGWTFLDAPGGSARPFAPNGPLDVDNGALLVPAAREDLGVVQVFDFMVKEDIQRGHLVELLPEVAAPGPAVRAVHPTSRRLLPRLQAFVAFMKADLRA